MGRQDATIDCPRGAISGRDRQGPAQIGDGGRVLDRDREPEQIVGDAEPGALHGAAALVAQRWRGPELCT